MIQKIWYWDRSISSLPFYRYSHRRRSGPPPPSVPWSPGPWPLSFGPPPPWPYFKVPHPGCQTSCLCPDKGCAERAPVLARHLAHPVVSDLPPSLPGEVKYPGLIYGPNDPVQVHQCLPPVAHHHMEDIPKALYPLLAWPHLLLHHTVVLAVDGRQLVPVYGRQAPCPPVCCFVPPFGGTPG